jgi:DNA-binding NarL/FixJ family response regulator
MATLLVVDDHEVVRRGTRQLLVEAFPDATVAEAPDARLALSVLVTTPVDLVVLDVALPGRDGLDLLVELRRRWPKVPVLVLSALPEEAFALRALRLGAAGFVAKGSSGEELLAAVRIALGGGRYLTPALARQLELGASECPDPREILSRRELEVARCVARGLTAREIAAQLNLSEKTIGTFRKRIGRKLGVTSNVELTRYAIAHGLV